MPVPRAWITRALVGSWVTPASLMLVAAASPFERPLAGTLGGLTLTTLELSIVVALAAGAHAFLRGAAFTWRTPITIPAVALLACALAATVAAPEFLTNSIRFVGRLTAALLLFLLAANTLTTLRVARQVTAVLLGAAALVGAIAVLELAHVPFVLDALKLFRPGFHVVGGQLRATSTLFYPTITSMYLEVAFALGLMWIASSRLAFVALAVTGAGIIATFTRAGLVTMTLSLLIYGGLVHYKRLGRGSLGEGGRWDGEHTRLAALTAMLLALVLVSRSPQMLMTRMSTEASQDWYGASYQVPATLTLHPDRITEVPVTLQNRGRLPWQATQLPVFALSYHWLSVDTEEVVIYDGLRTPFTTPVEPGEAATVRARVRAPGYPGTYLLVWDIVQEHRTWLSLEGVYPGRTIATVEGERAGAPLPTRGSMPTGVMRLPRSVLWTTALEMSAEHPVLGIGPDNFRLTYGRHLGLAAWDSRVHTNNTYLEVLVGMGAIGAAALLWLIVAACRATIARLRAADLETTPMVAAATAACVAIAAHGAVDSFLTFTATYVVFALAAGVLFRVLPPCPPSRSVSSEAYADRV
jgi:hypothetical protein